MDDADVRILRALQEDGRLTNNDLADKVSLSPSQCSRRRAALEASGVISSYHATLSSEALGLDVLVFVHVTLSTHSPNNADNFQTLVENLDEVQEAYSLTGESDYLGEVVGANSQSLVAASFRRVLTTSLGGACALIDRARSSEANQPVAIEARARQTVAS